MRVYACDFSGGCVWDSFMRRIECNVLKVTYRFGAFECFLFDIFLSVKTNKFSIEIFA